MFAQYYLRGRAGRAAASWVKTEDDMPGPAAWCHHRPAVARPGRWKTPQNRESSSGLVAAAAAVPHFCGHGRDNRVVTGEVGHWDTAP